MSFVNIMNIAGQVDIFIQMKGLFWGQLSVLVANTIISESLIIPWDKAHDPPMNNNKRI